MISGISAEGYAGCCEAIASMDLRPGLSSIAVPTLVVAGRQDPSIPPEHGKAIAAAVPGARFELLDPAAHLASVERADAVNALIAKHLAGLAVEANG
jgi:pimeloyl-ACP methyl ester carboxylesterase